MSEGTGQNDTDYHAKRKRKEKIPKLMQSQKKWFYNGINGSSVNTFAVNGANSVRLTNTMLAINPGTDIDNRTGLRIFVEKIYVCVQITRSSDTINSTGASLGAAATTHMNATRREIQANPFHCLILKDNNWPGNVPSTVWGSIYDCSTLAQQISGGTQYMTRNKDNLYRFRIMAHKLLWTKVRTHDTVATGTAISTLLYPDQEAWEFEITVNDTFQYDAANILTAPINKNLIPYLIGVLQLQSSNWSYLMSWRVRFIDVN